MFSSCSVKCSVKMTFWYFTTCFKYSISYFQKRFHQTVIQTRKNYIFVGCVSLFLKYRIFKRLAKALIKLRVCTGWSEALLVAHTTLLEISCSDSFKDIIHKHFQTIWVAEYRFTWLYRFLIFAPLLILMTLTNAYPIELMHSVASRICVFVFDNVPFDGHFVKC